MRIVEVKENKKQYLDLLLLADEQEDMIERYLDKGRMYVLNDGGVKCECVVTDEENGILEIKNIATVPTFQGKGYAKALIEFLVKEYEITKRGFLVTFLPLTEAEWKDLKNVRKQKVIDVETKK